MAAHEKGGAGHIVHPHEGEDHDTVKGVQNAALADVLSKQKPNPWTRRMFLLYACLLVATFNSCINGYDGSLMGGINALDQYRDYFGFPKDKGTPSTGIVYAIYTVGNIVGSFFAGPATDFRGRKWGMFIGSFIIILGTCIQAPSRNLAQFMAGRFMLGFGVAITASAGPSYVSEMAHPAYRGILTGIFNTFWFIGGVPGTFVPYGTQKLTDSMAWRIPIWVQMVFSGIVCMGTPFLPETPRWLIAHDRHEEALDVMAFYHGEGDRNAPVVQLQYREMIEDISVTGSDKRWWDYRELFNSPEVRYRSMLVIAMAFFGQWSGNGPVSYYYPQMLEGSGVKGKSKQLLYNGAQNIVSFSGAVFGAVFTDKWGRRPQLLVSTAIVIVFFTLICALNATNLAPDPKKAGAYIARDPKQAQAIVAIIFLFGFVFSAGYTPLQALYPVECLRYESRAKGMGMYNLFVNVAGFYNTFVTEIAFTGAGWKYYFLFIFWDLFEFTFIYFFFVETKQRTLEELTEIFQSRNRVKTSLHKTNVVVHAGEGVTAVDEKDMHA
ncbi:MFS lactose permease-like protein [Trichodelitschia bisporula]|uniref:MFS lactose permease-like protein n=1 Tax=Trichodelitschia bisporula TaxID=703511 RepID=A0A6G1HVB2_9PEZI|nr:MFS lactose permease-like protein [Trichodelitschia bisporula]